MKWCCLVVLALGAMGLLGTDQAVAWNNSDDHWWNQDYHWCPDPYDDAVGGDTYEIYKIGYAIEDCKLYVAVKTEFPIGGTTGGDSYDNRTFFSPGDLYLNVGGMFQMGTGTVYGIGTTDHSGDKTKDPNDGPWETVYDGKLYTGANFATGTFENYPTGTPSDGNDGDGQNDYPTLIMNYVEKISNVSGFKYKDYSHYNYYYYWVDLDAIGLGEGCDDCLEQSLQISWAMECGNDLAECKIEPCDDEVPEPATLGLVGAGIVALANRRRVRF